MKKILVILSLFILVGCTSSSKVEVKKKKAFSIKEEIKELHVQRDEYTLYGKAYIPSSKKKLPLVILSCGITATLGDYEQIAQMFQKKGIICVVYDFVGGAITSQSGGDMAKMSVYSEKKDLEAMISYMKKQNYVDTDQIYLAGHSQGGFVTALTANKRKDIQGLFLVAPGFNIPDLVKYVKSLKDGQTIYLLYGQVGNNYIQDAKKVKMYDDINKFEKVVYIFQGTNDIIVPSSYAKEVYKKYKDGHLELYKGEDHVFSKKAQQKMVDKASEVILKKAS